MLHYFLLIGGHDWLHSYLCVCRTADVVGPRIRPVYMAEATNKCSMIDDETQGG